MYKICNYNGLRRNHERSVFPEDSTILYGYDKIVEFLAELSFSYLKSPSIQANIYL